MKPLNACECWSWFWFYSSQCYGGHLLFLPQELGSEGTGIARFLFEKHLYQIRKVTQEAGLRAFSWERWKWNWTEQFYNFPKHVRRKTNMARFSSLPCIKTANQTPYPTKPCRSSYLCLFCCLQPPAFHCVEHGSCAGDWNIFYSFWFDTWGCDISTQGSIDFFFFLTESIFQLKNNLILRESSFCQLGQSPKILRPKPHGLERTDSQTIGDFPTRRKGMYFSTACSMGPWEFIYCGMFFS